MGQKQTQMGYTGFLQKFLIKVPNDTMCVRAISGQCRVCSDYCDSRSALELFTESGAGFNMAQNTFNIN